VEHLTATELAALVGCKSNQRAVMARWLDKNHWRYVRDTNGLPKVARAYYDRKMGLSNEKHSPKHADTPNLEAFAH